MHVDHIDLRRYKKYKRERERERERDGNLCGYYKYDKNMIHDSIWCNKIHLKNIHSINFNSSSTWSSTSNGTSHAAVTHLDIWGKAHIAAQLFDQPFCGSSLEQR